METPPKKVSLGSLALGVLFGGAWIFVAALIGFALFFGLMMGNDNGKHEDAFRMAAILSFSGSFVIVLGGVMLGMAISTSAGRFWKTFKLMIACGLGLHGICILSLLIWL